MPRKHMIFETRLRFSLLSRQAMVDNRSEAGTSSYTHRLPRVPTRTDVVGYAYPVLPSLAEEARCVLRSPVTGGS